MQYTPIINVIIRAIRKATPRLVRDFNEVEQLQVSRKGTAGFVSAADIRVDNILKEELLKARPDFGFLSEESEEVKGKDPRWRWIVDPIDGTTNLIHGVPYFCISVALEHTADDGTKEITAGVTYAPILQELFWVEKSKGAWLEMSDGSFKKLRMTSRHHLPETLLASGSTRRDAEEIRKISEEVHGIRCFGSSALALAYLAAGRLDGFFQQQAELWDIAAGVLFVSEAGGLVTSYTGEKNVLKGKTILAANRTLHPLLLAKCN